MGFHREQLPTASQCVSLSFTLPFCLEREASLFFQSGVLCHLEVVVKFNLYHVMSPEDQPRCDYEDPWQLALTFWDGNIWLIFLFSSYS